MKKPMFEEGDIRLWGNDEPICPYCGSRQEMTDIAPVDGDVEYFECDSCEEMIEIHTRVEVLYNTAPTND